MAKDKKSVTKVTPKKGALRPRPTGGSWHSRFLDLLGETCNVTLAAEGAGTTRKTAYEHYKLFPEFREAWEDAKAAAVERLEAEAWTRARGQSDTLLIFLLKAHKPEMYREKFEHNHKGNVVLTFAELAQLATDEQPETSDHDS